MRQKSVSPQAESSTVTDWSLTQDRQISEAFDAKDLLLSDPSPVRRLWGVTDGFIAAKHLINVHSVKRRDEPFKAIDVGCGDGDLLSHLAGQFPLAIFTGIDTNEKSISRASVRNVPRCSFLCESFAVVEGLFDIVICSEVMEHVEASDRLLDKLRDLVTPGGYLSISTPSGWMYRTPRLYNIYKLVKNPRRFWRLYLRPEGRWPEAVRVHPGILPSKLRRKLENRGFSLVLRQSALWWFQEPGITEKLFRAWGSRRAALLFFHLSQFMDAAMNLVPVLRCGETRAILLMQRREEP
jgi:2-polyprenyl-3-methyl-5-hydroxy-6-metoxy-1,4-benzoquinol methylase